MQAPATMVANKLKDQSILLWTHNPLHHAGTEGKGTANLQESHSISLKNPNAGLNGWLDWTPPQFRALRPGPCKPDIHAFADDAPFELGNKPSIGNMPCSPWWRYQPRAGAGIDLQPCCAGLEGFPAKSARERPLSEAQHLAINQPRPPASSGSTRHDRATPFFPSRFCSWRI